MAIYQFKLNLIPEKGLINHIGFIPHKLKINFEERNEHYYLKEDGLLEDSDLFTDPLTANLWNSREVIIAEIIYYISKAFPRKPQKSINEYYWKHYSRFVDNDASLIINKNNETIEELYFRADLRGEGLVFLNEMITIAEKFDCLLMDVSGNLIKPDKNEVYKLVKLSNSYKFLSDPEDFFKNLTN